MEYTDEYLKEAHEHCRRHREAVEAGKCGCFYCLKIFDGSKVRRWVDRRPKSTRTGAYEHNTAMCPHCDLDMVLPAARGLPIDDPEFLKGMHRVWVETTYDIAEIKAARAEGREPVPHEPT